MGTGSSIVIYRYDEDLAPPRSTVDSTRVWVSDQQWLAVLERVQRGQDIEVPATDCRRLHVRQSYTCRCLLRLADAAGTYAVRSRDLSEGGLRFVHGHPLRPGMRCTVVLQPEQGLGRILSAVVAWCNEIEFYDEDLEAYEIGVKFDDPLDTRSFVSAA